MHAVADDVGYAMHAVVDDVGRAMHPAADGVEGPQVLSVKEVPSKPQRALPSRRRLLLL
jgi:hypothetical protein